MELAPDRPNVELRRSPEGGQIVVLGFPYDAHIVNVVRSIPGRRFDWDAREWWAPVDDWVGVHVADVLERFPDLTASASVDAWLAQIQKRWVGHVSTVRHDGRGWWVLATRAGTPPEALVAGFVERDGMLLAPLDRRGRCRARRRGQRAAGCRRKPLRRSAADRRGPAARPPHGGADVRRRAAAAGRPVGPRDRQGVRQAAGRRGSGTDAAGRSVGRRGARRVHRAPRRRGRRAGAVHARAVARRARRGAGGDPLVARDGRRADRGGRGGSRRRARAVSVGGRALRAARSAGVHRRRAGARQDRRGAGGARGRRGVPRDRRLPRVAEAQLAARDREVAAAPRGEGRRRPGRGRADRRDHDPQLRDRRGAPRGAGAAAAACAGHRRVALRQEPAGKAHARGAQARRRGRRPTACAWR